MLTSALLHCLGRGLETRGRPRRPAPARSFRPRVEALETYQLMSTFSVVLATDSGGPTGQKVTATTGDLRYCIEQADAVHGATTDTINFSATLFGTPQTITLKSGTGPLVLNDSHPLTINGPTGDTVTVSGGDAVEVFDITGGTVTISHLAISHGKASGDGGGIYNNGGTLRLTNCTLDHDQARDGGGLFSTGGTVTIVGSTFNHDSAGVDGGGIWDLGTLTVSSSNLSNNSAGDFGGGIVDVGTLTVSSSNLSNNSAAALGGGIYIHVSSTAKFTQCTLSNDSAGEDGGGVFVNDRSKATLSNCTLSNDSVAINAGGGLCTDGTGSATLSNCTLSNDSAVAGGGISNPGGTVSLSNCTLSNDSHCAFVNQQFGTATVTACTFNNDSAVAGGGIDNLGTATVTACTFNNDSANYGGGIENNGTATLTNCTFSNDSATYASTGGGGISNAGGATITVTNCTLANNSAVNGSGGGIWNAGGGTLILTNTIVAENTAVVAGPDISGNVNTADHNLIGNGSGSTVITDLGGNLVGGNGNPVIDPRLGPLQNNGGPTLTLALLADSPAIGHGNHSKAPATDQRGTTRIDELGETTDIGAYER